MEKIKQKKRYLCLIPSNGKCSNTPFIKEVPSEDNIVSLDWVKYVIKEE